MKRLIPIACLLILFGCSAPKEKLDIVMKTSGAEGGDPFEVGKQAATVLKESLGTTTPHAIVMVDSFEEKALKEKALEGVTSVFPRETIYGGATYGVITQAGSLELDSVGLLAIGGSDIAVTSALAKDMGAAGLSLETDEEELSKALGESGAELGRQLSGDGALMIVMADAHSPKNQLLIDGIQSVVGKELPITGGSVNKNDGQNWIYYRGELHTDSAFGLMLTGDFEVSQVGRQAKTNDAVIATAEEGAALALENLDSEPFAVLAYNCGGRMGKLDDVAEELKAFQASIGDTTPIFGCYCAGEFGPADEDETRDDGVSYGRGWHVMITALGQ
jgi:hypothetical protein